MRVTSYYSFVVVKLAIFVHYLFDVSTTEKKMYLLGFIAIFSGFLEYISLFFFFICHIKLVSSLWVKTWSVFLSIYVLFPMRILKFLCSRKGKIHFTYDFAAQVKISKPIEYAIHWRRHGFTSNGPVSTSVALHSVIMIDMRAVFFSLC